jgi:hypothetical protein
MSSQQRVEGGEGVSDTPRTDEEASDGWSGDAECVSAEFARALERELTACRDERLRARNAALGAGYNSGDLAEIITDLAAQLAACRENEIKIVAQSG